MHPETDQYRPEEYYTKLHKRPGHSSQQTRFIRSASLAKSFHIEQ